MQKVTGVQRAVGLGLLLLGCDEPFYCDQALSCDAAEAGTAAEAGKPESETSTTTDPASETTDVDGGDEIHDTEAATTSPSTETGDSPGTADTPPKNKPLVTEDDDSASQPLVDAATSRDASADDDANIRIGVADASVIRVRDASGVDEEDASTNGAEKPPSPSPTLGAPVASSSTTLSEDPTTSPTQVVDSGQPELSTVEMTTSDPVTEGTTTTSCGTACEEASAPAEPCTDPTECGSWGAPVRLDPPAMYEQSARLQAVALDGDGRCGILWRKADQHWFGYFEGDQTVAPTLDLLPEETEPDVAGWSTLIGNETGFDAIRSRYSSGFSVRFISNLGLGETPLPSTLLGQPADNGHLSAARDNDGNVVVGWRGDGHPLSNRFDAATQEWLGMEQIDDSIVVNPPVVAATTVGGVAAWQASVDGAGQLLVSNYEGDGPWENVQPLDIDGVAQLKSKPDGRVVLLATGGIGDAWLAEFDPASATWTEPRAVPSPSDGYPLLSYSLLAVDSAGGMWVGGAGNGDGEMVIGFRHLNAIDGTWGSLEVVGHPTEEGDLLQQPELAISPSGHLFVAWRETNEGSYQHDFWTCQRSASSGSWTKPRRVSHGDIGKSFEIRIRSVADTHAVMVWEQFMGEFTQIWTSRFQ